MMHKTWMLTAALTLALSPISAFAQESYPSAPIKIVIGFPPGASADFVARLLAPKLAAQMNASIVVENKPGANANIAAESVAKSRPDGYTLLLNSPGAVLSRAFGEKTGYDLFKDLTPVALVVSAPQMIVMHPSVPANTVPEFIAYLRANPGKLAYGTGGVGSLNHLGTLLFLQANGLTALHVPYKGSAQSLVDVVGGQVQFAMQGLTAALPMIKDKRVKVLGLLSLKRSPFLPDVPTFAETMPGFEVGTWYGVLAPAAAPAAIVKRLNAEILKVLQDSEFKSRLASDGMEPLPSSPEAYGAYLKSEVERWSKAIQAAGVKPE